MEIISFTSEQSRKIRQYGSRGVSITPVIQQSDCFSVVRIYIEPQGCLGAHPAAADQLFLVVEGDGFVSSGSQDKSPIQHGNAVLWSKGEIHQTRAGDSGLLAVVVEGDGLADSLSPPQGRSSS